jgi:anti-sigma factor RsiW
MTKRLPRRRTVSEDELHALLDDALDPQRREEVAAAIAADPELSARVKAYEAQRRGLHALYDNILSEPIPDRLLNILKEPKGK